jgi:hypothetical protein
MSLAEVDLRLETAQRELNREWNTKRVHARFNRPSSQLCDTRVAVRVCLNSRHFDEASWHVRCARKLEKEELKAATRTIVQSHRIAEERLRQRFDAERQAIAEQFDANWQLWLREKRLRKCPFRIA